MKKFISLIALLLVTSTALSAEIVSWAHPWLKPMSSKEPPPTRPEKVIRLRTTPGEYEPACFAVRSDKDAEVTVSLARAAGSNASQALLRSTEIMVVESLADSTQPNRLYEFSGTVKVRAGRTRYFWITVR
ncbi:MAG: hypothetical protein V1794_18390, partial [Candidatus Glassbacteria bacterium]